MDIKRILTGEIFAVRGKYTDIYSTQEILSNLPNFEIWFYKDCISTHNILKFNLDFLGKWRKLYNEKKTYRNNNARS